MSPGPTPYRSVIRSSSTSFTQSSNRRAVFSEASQSSKRTSSYSGGHVAEELGLALVAELGVRLAVPDFR